MHSRSRAARSPPATAGANASKRIRLTDEGGDCYAGGLTRRNGDLAYSWNSEFGGEMVERTYSFKKERYTDKPLNISGDVYYDDSGDEDESPPVKQMRDRERYRWTRGGMTHRDENGRTHRLKRGENLPGIVAKRFLGDERLFDNVWMGDALACLRVEDGIVSVDFVRPPDPNEVLTVTRHGLSCRKATPCRGPGKPSPTPGDTDE